MPRHIEARSGLLPPPCHPPPRPPHAPASGPGTRRPSSPGLRRHATGTSKPAAGFYCRLPSTPLGRHAPNHRHQPGLHWHPPEHRSQQRASTAALPSTPSAATPRTTTINLMAYTTPPRPPGNAEPGLGLTHHRRLPAAATPNRVQRRPLSVGHEPCSPVRPPKPDHQTALTHRAGASAPRFPRVAPPVPWRAQGALGPGTRGPLLPARPGRPQTFHVKRRSHPAELCGVRRPAPASPNAKPPANQGGA